MANIQLGISRYCNLSGGWRVLTRLLLSTIAILLIFEGLRRVTGWILVGLGLVFILYARFTWLVPGIFSGPGIPWERLPNYLFLDPNGMLGTPMEVTAGIVLAFILFGDLLFGVGGGPFLTNMAMSTFGRFRGGPAKMAVVASGLFGTISGSAVANVAATGVITIPLMKQIGYKPHLAGADAMRTGYAAMRLGIVAFILPFLFVLSPALLLMGPPGDIAVATVTAIIGCFLLGSGATGYLFQELNLPKRVLMVLAGIGLLIPAQVQIFKIGLLSDIIGGSLALVLLIWEWRRRLKLVVTSKTESEKSNEGGQK